MAQKSGSSKKKRTPKTSAGVNGGGGKVKLTELQKVLMNKGMGHGTRFGDKSKTATAPKSRPKRRPTFWPGATTD